MNESWLERGHGSKPAHLDTIFTSTDRNRPLARDHGLGVSEPFGTAASTPRRSSRLVVVTALWFGIIVGTSGAAWAVRDALFPSIGPAEVSVWQNPGRDTQPAPSDDSTTTTAVVPAIAATPTDVSPPTSVESNESNEGPGNSTTSPTNDNDDNGGKHGESTVATAADDTSSTVDDDGGGHGGTGPVDDSGPGGGSGSGHGSDSGGGSGSGGGSDD